LKKGLLHTIHSIAGLISGVFILVLSLTGALLVFNASIDRWQQPRISTVANNTSVLPLKSCYDSVQFRFPSAHMSHVVLHNQDQMAHSFYL
jgi:uncharacterized iron-regulated membrane protein